MGDTVYVYISGGGEKMPKIKADLTIEKRNFDWYVKGSNILEDKVEEAWEFIKTYLSSVDGISHTFESILDHTEEGEALGLYDDEE